MYDYVYFICWKIFCNFNKFNEKQVLNLNIIKWKWCYKYMIIFKGEDGYCYVLNVFDIKKMLV